jgi:hypothetical protein
MSGLDINTLAELWRRGQLADYENAVAWSRELQQAPADVDDLEPLEPVDRDELLRLHRCGVDVVEAFGHSLRAHGEGEPRTVIRTFPSALRVS